MSFQPAPMIMMSSTTTWIAVLWETWRPSIVRFFINFFLFLIITFGVEWLVNVSTADLDSVWKILSSTSLKEMLDPSDGSLKQYNFFISNWFISNQGSDLLRMTIEYTCPLYRGFLWTYTYMHLHITNTSSRLYEGYKRIFERKPALHFINIKNSN